MSDGQILESLGGVDALGIQSYTALLSLLQHAPRAGLVYQQYGQILNQFGVSSPGFQASSYQPRQVFSPPQTNTFLNTPQVTPLLADVSMGVFSNTVQPRPGPPFASTPQVSPLLAEMSTVSTQPRPALLQAIGGSGSLSKPGLDHLSGEKLTERVQQSLRGSSHCSTHDRFLCWTGIAC